METLEQFTDDLEVYSVDEAFLKLKDFKGTKDFPMIEDYLLHIKETVERETGIPVSVGAGPTKTLAKIANHISKGRESSKGVMSLLEKSSCDVELAKVPIEEIWGIGRALAPRLRVLGINTAKDLRDYPNERHILKEFSKVEAFRIKELQGIQKLGVSLSKSSKKSIMCSRSFGSSVGSLEELKAAVSHHAFTASTKLRKQNSTCRRLRVFIRTDRFKDVEQHYDFKEVIMDISTSDSMRIVSEALKLLEKIYIKGFKYKKAGVWLGQISSDDKLQLSLFEKHDSVKSANLMKSIDAINKKSGQNTIKFAVSTSPKKTWKATQNLKSPSYLTGWNELPKLK